MFLSFNLQSFYDNSQILVPVPHWAQYWQCQFRRTSLKVGLDQDLADQSRVAQSHGVSRSDVTMSDLLDNYLALYPLLDVTQDTHHLTFNGSEISLWKATSLRTLIRGLGQVRQCSGSRQSFNELWHQLTTSTLCPNQVDELNSRILSLIPRFGACLSRKRLPESIWSLCRFWIVLDEEICEKSILDSGSSKVQGENMCIARSYNIEYLRLLCYWNILMFSVPFDRTSRPSYVSYCRVDKRTKKGVGYRLFSWRFNQVK